MTENVFVSEYDNRSLYLIFIIQKKPNLPPLFSKILVKIITPIYPPS